MHEEKTIKNLPAYQWREQPVQPPRHARYTKKDQFVKRYGIFLMCACIFTLYTIVLSSLVHIRTERITRLDMEEEFARRLETMQAEQEMERSRSFFLSGEASREAFINQEVDAVAAVIAKLATDTQKATEASCMLARVMNAAYPGTFQEVAEQPQQWPLYDGKDRTFSQRDREIADSIVRPYVENGMIPNGLTSEMVYAAWSTNDLVLRDSYQNSGIMNTWRYQG